MKYTVMKQVQNNTEYSTHKNTNHCFSISDIRISVKSDYEYKMEDNFESFLCDELYDYQVEFKEISKLPVKPGKMIYKSRNFCVSEENAFKRYFYDGLNNDYYYAVGTYNWSQKHILIEYIPYAYQFINEISNSFFHIALEALLMNENRMILHSTCIDTLIGGLLFAGESGAGKSTQTDLWCKYENGYLINGDRTIICNNSGYLGYGSPYAGSSKCYKNESCKITAIIFPKKAKINSVRKLSSSEAFKKIYSCMVINSWDKVFVSKTCDFVMNLINDIPVYELSCTMDKDAVDCLKKRLMEDVRYAEKI